MFRFLAWQQDFSKHERKNERPRKLNSFVKNKILFRDILRNTTWFVTLVFYLRQYKLKVNYFEQNHALMFFSPIVISDFKIGHAHVENYLNLNVITNQILQAVILSSKKKILNHGHTTCNTKKFRL